VCVFKLLDSQCCGDGDEGALQLRIERFQARATAQSHLARGQKIGGAYGLERLLCRVSPVQFLPKSNSVIRVGKLGQKLFQHKLKRAKP